MVAANMSVGVFIGLTLLLSVADNALAQSPGYRMRMPGGSPIGGHIGVSGRPPRLSVPSDGTLDRTGGPSGRRFLPYENFGWYFVDSEDYEYADDSTAGAFSRETEPEPARDIYPVYDSLPEVGPLEVSSRRITSGIVARLTWRDRGLGAEQVAFFLADSVRGVLSAETDRSAPFTAVFQPPPGTAFAGMTVVLPGGNLVTRFIPYRRR